MTQNPPPPWFENFRELIKPRSSRLRRRRKILKPTLAKMLQNREKIKPRLLKMRCGEKFGTCARSAQKIFRGLLGGFLKISVNLLNFWLTFLKSIIQSRAPQAKNFKTHIVQIAAKPWKNKTHIAQIPPKVENNKTQISNFPDFRSLRGGGV